ncbi:hypothetical protein BYT27DRAFT_7183659 [Phlegmacium glaucopus]|nr:hypothetical protein BYT27DRAFT_7203213 [Phlegmacium glaucopus]KAF8811724.1 hypothetical protein BYT27DRAFT_7183659 [Phlegmacium glaucopus]
MRVHAALQDENVLEFLNTVVVVGLKQKKTYIPGLLDSELGDLLIRLVHHLFRESFGLKVGHEGFM